MPPVYADPCRGHFSHPQRHGCCPIQITAANRALTDGARTATTGTYIPTDLCQAIDNHDLRFLNKDDHTNDSAYDVANATVDDLMVAAQGGVIDGASAMAEIARRIPGTAGDADLRGILTSSITAIKAMMETGIVIKSGENTNGNLVRLWALSMKRTLALGGPLLTSDGADAMNIDVTVTDASHTSRAKLQIRRATTEAIFDTAVYMWTALAHSLGIMPLEISMHFVFEAVHSLRCKHKEDFWTAQEYLIECMDLVDRGICKAQSVANHDRNLVLDKARRLGAAFAEAAARVRNPLDAPMPNGGRTKVWNGNFQPADSKANLCQNYNRNKAHDDPKWLTADGTCKFRHLCNRWVTDKGPSGKCERENCAWFKCSNPAKCNKALD